MGSVVLGLRGSLRGEAGPGVSRALRALQAGAAAQAQAVAKSRGAELSWRQVDTAQPLCGSVLVQKRGHLSKGPDFVIFPEHSNVVGYFPTERIQATLGPGGDTPSFQQVPKV